MDVLASDVSCKPDFCFAILGLALLGVHWAPACGVDRLVGYHICLDRPFFNLHIVRVYIRRDDSFADSPGRRLTSRSRPFAMLVFERIGAPYGHTAMCFTLSSLRISSIEQYHAVTCCITNVDSAPTVIVQRQHIFLVICCYLAAAISTT
jgi:hypothetical protein